MNDNDVLNKVRLNAAFKAALEKIEDPEERAKVEQLAMKMARDITSAFIPIISKFESDPVVRDQVASELQHVFSGSTKA